MNETILIEIIHKISGYYPEILCISKVLKQSADDLLFRLITCLFVRVFDTCQISGLKETGRLAPEFSLTFITFYRNKLGFLDMIGQKSLTKIDVYENTGI